MKSTMETAEYLRIQGLNKDIQDETMNSIFAAMQDAILRFEFSALDRLSPQFYAAYERYQEKELTITALLRSARKRAIEIVAGYEITYSPDIRYYHFVSATSMKGYRFAEARAFLRKLPHEHLEEGQISSVDA